MEVAKSQNIRSAEEIKTEKQQEKHSKQRRKIGAKP